MVINRSMMPVHMVRGQKRIVKFTVWTHVTCMDMLSMSAKIGILRDVEIRALFRLDCNNRKFQNARELVNCILSNYWILGAIRIKIFQLQLKWICHIYRTVSRRTHPPIRRSFSCNSVTMNLFCKSWCSTHPTSTRNLNRWSCFWPIHALVIKRRWTISPSNWSIYWRTTRQDFIELQGWLAARLSWCWDQSLSLN